ncbi:NAD-dependent epimerase/dehydratase family protein [Paraliomyxa miuraensis]|uniref:NAD-dependent epimerase/dehydratase family protein n=1 Tax=Paraliomyxa miuraensis TaxID=376150 RepID=UPI00225774D3|nr:NAD-dependent epimerase/dehydratase family protein [Paraliomyxa miuraensis]MCX4240501.1 NAD-dependent epimerase/dehydratase family protein [Paraliomyxa miuraensis]
MTTTPLTDWPALHGDCFRAQRVLVTGGAGFIGSHLAQALDILGAEVVVLDNLDGGSRDNLGGLRVDFLEGSILDAPLLARAIEGCRYVFHLAALGSVPRSVAEPLRFHEVNATGTLRVLEAARQAGVARVMFSASSSAYGDDETVPKRESMPPVARSPYAATKLAGEALLAAYAACHPALDTVSLRYFNIFGPRQNANSAYAAVIAAFAAALLQGRRATIYGDGEQSRDFAYVDDAVHANLLAARSQERLDGLVLNVGCARRITVNALYEAMASMAGRTELRPVYEPPRAGDVRHSLAALEAIEARLGYRSVVGFEDGLRATMQWYRGG